MYCTECGTPMEYAASKPKFCMNCGYNFETKAKVAAANPDKVSKPSSNEEPIDADSEEFDVKEIDPRIYSMTGLDVDITQAKEKTLTFGDLFPQNEEKKDNSKNS